MDEPTTPTAQSGGEVAARPIWLRGAAVIAAAFGILTIAVGGRTLFDPSARAAAGNVVSFVLWFNFVAGFAYVAAAVGLFRGKRWAAVLAAAIAVATLAVFAAFGLRVLLGGSFEVRTVGAMALRSAFWLGIAIASCRVLGCRLLPAGRSTSDAG
jgi:hypothetical protein